MLTAAGAVSAGIALNQVRDSPVAPNSSRPRPSRPNSCVISQVLTSCQSWVEYALLAKSGDQCTDPRSTYGLSNARRAFVHFSKCATIRPDEISVDRSGDARARRRDSLFAREDALR